MAAKTPKPLTKSQIAAEVAEKTGITKKAADNVFEIFAELAYEQIKANSSFTIPGIGKLVRIDRPKRTGRNPQTGESIKIAAKKVVKFRVSKACKDAIEPPKKSTSSKSKKSASPKSKKSTSSKSKKSASPKSKK
ncbi:MAG: Integration host factor subunit alpha [Verrucomicrobia subdivision 3 bacterium]|nr:Integration host factor subunit alpha [Limisphaerales bacterium]MCS1416140.1 Integration host factor subunit alpha [Limisphaerales bacterium]